MTITNYLFSPKLYKDYRHTTSAVLYEAIGVEKWGDQILSTLNLMFSCCYYSSPIILTFLYRRGYLVMDSIGTLAKLTTGISIICIISLCMRGIGRAKSPQYARFFKAFDLSKQNQNNSELRKALREFDFEFKYWPVDWSVKEVKGSAKVEPVELVNISKGIKCSGLVTIPYEIAAYLAINLFGLKMIYPGSLKIFQSYFHPMLVEGRQKLIQEQNGVRYKLEACDKNQIDTVFVDNRDKSANGKVLVVCSEGNAGFYEIGIAATPLSLQYSVLGWNHPGFGGSTGQPFPNQDQNAFDAVIQFAIEKLDFQPENIILFGWSIGGYSSIYGAARYPRVKGVILDATFDDILPLALPRMPQSLAGVVEYAIRSYVNLNNVELLKQYNGPVFIIRRTEDEVIAEDLKLGTNRGNFLLVKLLAHRFPNIFKEKQCEHILNLLKNSVENLDRNTEIEDTCFSLLVSHISKLNEKVYPLDIGAEFDDQQRLMMAIYLTKKHFVDYKSSHCTPLPAEFFKQPWELPNEETDFVFT